MNIWVICRFGPSWQWCIILCVYECMGVRVPPTQKLGVDLLAHRLCLSSTFPDEWLNLELLSFHIFTSTFCSSLISVYHDHLPSPSFTKLDFQKQVKNFSIYGRPRIYRIRTYSRPLIYSRPHVYRIRITKGATQESMFFRTYPSSPDN